MPLSFTRRAGEQHRVLYLVGTVLTVALDWGAAASAARALASGPVYTVARIVDVTTLAPRPWVGRERWVRGVAVAIPRWVRRDGAMTATASRTGPSPRGGTSDGIPLS